MSEYTGIALTALTIGLAYAAVPGAVNTESMRRTLNHGMRDGWLVQAGSLVGDVLWAIIGLTGAAVLLDRDSVTVTLGLIGGGFLLLLAKSALHAAIRGSSTTGDAHSGNALKVGITFGLANPAGIAFWSGLGAGTLGLSGQSGVTPMIILLGSFCLGALIWGGFMVLLLGYGRRFLAGRVLRWVDALCATVLGWFGIRLLWSSLKRGWRLAAPGLRLIG
jgi:threonine/homoserine/homoserine lactone efflux protein